MHEGASWAQLGRKDCCNHTRQRLDGWSLVLHHNRQIDNLVESTGPVKFRCLRKILTLNASVKNDSLLGHAKPRFESFPVSPFVTTFRNNRPALSGWLVIGVASTRTRVQLLSVAEPEELHCPL